MGVGQLEGPELVKPWTAAGGVEDGDRQDRADADAGDAARERDLAPSRGGGRGRKGADVGRLVAQDCSLRRQEPDGTSTNSRVARCLSASGPKGRPAQMNMSSWL